MGTAQTPAHCVRPLVVLADMPRVESADIDRLVAAFVAAGGDSVVRATHAGKRGNPVILPRRCSVLSPLWRAIPARVRSWRPRASPWSTSCSVLAGEPRCRHARGAEARQAVSSASRLEAGSRRTDGSARSSSEPRPRRSPICGAKNHRAAAGPAGFLRQITLLAHLRHGDEMYAVPRWQERFAAEA